MTAPEKVNSFLTESSDWLCSDCIAKELGFGNRAQAVLITAALATTSEFVRGIGRCALCEREKMVARRAPQEQLAKNPTRFSGLGPSMSLLREGQPQECDTSGPSDLDWESGCAPPADTNIGRISLRGGPTP